MILRVIFTIVTARMLTASAGENAKVKIAAESKAVIHSMARAMEGAWFASSRFSTWRVTKMDNSIPPARRKPKKATAFKPKMLGKLKLSTRYFTHRRSQPSEYNP